MNQNTDVLRANIAKKLENSEYYIPMVLDENRTEFTEFEFPQLSNYQIYHFQFFDPHRPIIFYIAYDKENMQSELLTGRPENFIKIVKNEHLSLNSSKDAQLFLVNFLEVSQDFSSVMYIINSYSDLPIQAELSDAEQNIITELRFAYPSLTPQIEKNDDRFIISQHLIVGEELIRKTYSVKSNGEIEVLGMEIISKDLPLIYHL